MKKTTLKKKSKSPTAKLQQELTKLSHDYIRARDSEQEGVIGGKCFDCDNKAYGQQFQAGHWIPDASGGALLRYHPGNMHGQTGGCNMAFVQERVKINYTFAMLEKYGNEYVQKLRQLKEKSIKADSIFYERMIELYKEGKEENIVKYLESLVT